MPTNKTSVIMCTYNGEDYIIEQLNSIINQSILPDEIIILDDNSSDNTVRIIEKFQKKISINIAVYKNDSNLGIIKNFEKGINLANNEIILLCDQDDIWHYDKIKTVVEVLEDNKIGYVFSNAEIVDYKNKKLNIDLWKIKSINKEIINNFESCNLDFLLFRSNLVLGCTLAFKKALVSKIIPIMSESAVFTHDTWIILSLAAFKIPGKGINKKLINYRQHEKQFSGVFSKKNKDSYNVNTKTLFSALTNLANNLEKNNCGLAEINKIKEKANFLEFRVSLRENFSISYFVKKFEFKLYKKYGSGMISLVYDFKTTIVRLLSK